MIANARHGFNLNKTVDSLALGILTTSSQLDDSIIQDNLGWQLHAACIVDEGVLPVATTATVATKSHCESTSGEKCTSIKCKKNRLN